MAKYDVFISCSLKDSDEIKEFVNLLTDCIPGILCYTDAEKDEFDETQKMRLTTQNVSSLCSPTLRFFCRG